jgi:hypothetical protein
MKNSTAEVDHEVIGCSSRQNIHVKIFMKNAWNNPQPDHMISFLPIILQWGKSA